MTDLKSFVFRFGDIEVRENEYAFTRAGETVKVEPTAFRVLLYLLRNSGRLVTKDEIMAAVWHDTAVSDNSLTRSVATLRRVLNDNSREPRYIATIQTLGYRFLVPVEKYPVSATSQPADAPEPDRKEENGSPVAPPPVQAPSPAPVRRTVSIWLIAACPGLLLAALLAGVHFFGGGRSHANAGSPYPSFKAPRAVVTVPGVANESALSPDGKLIAFAWRSQTQPRNDL